jgi:hypothetical protein
VLIVGASVAGRLVHCLLALYAELSATLAGVLAGGYPRLHEHPEVPQFLAGVPQGGRLAAGPQRHLIGDPLAAQVAQQPAAAPVRRLQVLGIRGVVPFGEDRGQPCAGRGHAVGPVAAVTLGLERFPCLLVTRAGKPRGGQLLIGERRQRRRGGKFGHVRALRSSRSVGSGLCAPPRV